MAIVVKGRLLTSVGTACIPVIGSVSALVCPSLAGAAPPPSAPACFTAARQLTGGIKIADMWSGVRTQVGAAMAQDGTVYAAYYDPDRYMSVASYNARTKRVCHIRLASRFGGWDAHNGLAVAISTDRVIHVTGNMHHAPLVYARGTSLGTIKPASMTGRNERHVTYPQFLPDADGALLFQYRDGSSGDGVWRLNRWAGGQWAALPLLFVDEDAGKPTSAYPTDFLRDKTGRFHVAIIWRRTSNVASNYKLTYASTRDFRTWQVNGQSVKGPLGPDNMELVDNPGEGAGLVNNAAIHMGSDGQPLIVYTKYAPDGRNAIYLASRGKGVWQDRILAKSPARMDLEGGGSIADLPNGRFVEDAAGRLLVKANFGKAGQREIMLDAQASVKRARAPVGKAERPFRPASIAIPKGMAASIGGAADIYRNGLGGPSYGQLRWFGQKPRRDSPYPCSDTAPRACTPPPSPLILYLVAREKC